MSPLFILALVLAIGQQQVYSVYGAAVTTTVTTTGTTPAAPVATNDLLGGLTSGLSSLTGGLTNTLTGAVANTQTGGLARPFNPINGALDGMTNLIGGFTQQMGSVTNSIIAGTSPLLGATGNLLNVATSPVTAITGSISNPALASGPARPPIVSPAAAASAAVAPTSQLGAATGNLLSAATNPVAGLTNTVTGVVSPLLGGVTGALGLKNPVVSPLGGHGIGGLPNPLTNPTVADAASLTLPTALQTLTRPLVSLLGPASGLPFAGANPQLANQLTNPLGLGIHKTLSTMSGLTTGIAAGMGLNEVEKVLSAQYNRMLDDFATASPGALSAGSTLINDAPVRALYDRAPVGNSVTSGAITALHGNYNGITGASAAQQLGAIEGAKLAATGPGLVRPKVPYEETFAAREFIGDHNYLPGGAPFVGPEPFVAQQYGAPFVGPDPFVAQQYGGFGGAQIVAPGAALGGGAGFKSEYAQAYSENEVPSGCAGSYANNIVSETVLAANSFPGQLGPVGPFPAAGAAPALAEYAADAAVDTPVAPITTNAHAASVAAEIATATSPGLVENAAVASQTALAARPLVRRAACADAAGFGNEFIGASAAIRPEVYAAQHYAAYGPFPAAQVGLGLEPGAGLASGVATGFTPGIAAGSALGLGSGLVTSNAPGIATGFTPGVATGFAHDVAAGFSPGVATGFAHDVAASFSPGVATGFAPGVATGFAHDSAAGFVPGGATGFVPGVATGFAHDVAASSTSGIASSMGPSLAPGIATDIAPGVIIGSPSSITPGLEVTAAAAAPIATTATATVAAASVPVAPVAPVAAAIEAPVSPGLAGNIVPEPLVATAAYPEAIAASPIQAGIGYSPAVAELEAPLPIVGPAVTPAAVPISRFEYNVAEAPVINAIGEAEPEAWLRVRLVNYFDIPLRALTYGPYNPNPWIQRLPIGPVGGLIGANAF